jgi:two-component system, OmpR family, phosphate regulon response regulator PhoB
MPDSILIVDDESELVASLDFNLRREGFETRTAMTAQAAWTQANLEPRPSLILMDWMLPDGSGTELCRRMRADARLVAVPIIMVTARGEEIDRVVGLEVGADDYVVKPFSVRELMLRIRSLLRRGAAPPVKNQELLHGVLRVDLESHRAWVGQEEVALTVLELRLLATLLQRRGRVQSRDQLLQDVWELRSGIESRTVDTHVRRLRSKLGSAGDYIETIRGVGYRLRERDERLAS